MKMLKIEQKFVSSKWRNPYSLFSRPFVVMYDLSWSWATNFALKGPFMVLCGLLWSFLAVKDPNSCLLSFSKNNRFRWCKSSQNDKDCFWFEPKRCNMKLQTYFSLELSENARQIWKRSQFAKHKLICSTSFVFCKIGGTRDMSADTGWSRDTKCR